MFCVRSWKSATETLEMVTSASGDLALTVQMFSDGMNISFYDEKTLKTTVAVNSFPLSSSNENRDKISKLLWENEHFTLRMLLSK